ncbi:SH3 domain containing GRB2 like 2a, endophilin A1 isoform X1 [Pseudochaenichthys georgianus]|uniref:SH3 domain containing GRB2 like 2a, endophilin A1 isoform X1 n=1 Tax=Pseudochaenichthys georgianus TaxID=52239 RepID=UPI0039C00FC4
MSVAGLKKQFHKATQKVSEKVGGAEGTKLDDDFTEMEKKMDTTARAVLDIMTKTTEYLQPNPATRAKMSMINSMSRMRGQEKGPGYTQTEAILGESMQRFGRELGEESNFGGALIEAGEAMRELGEVKDALDIEVKQNFIDPMQNLHEKDLKEIQHHLKKMEGRRLDFDYKKKRQGKCTDDELKQALEKFDDSKEIAEQSMFNLIESDIEQVSQLAALVHAQVEYHSRAAEILTQLSSKIDERIKDTSVKPRKEYAPKARTSLDFSISENHNGGIHNARSPGPRSPAVSPGETKKNPWRDTTVSPPSLRRFCVHLSLLQMVQINSRKTSAVRSPHKECSTYRNNEKLYQRTSICSFCFVLLSVF